MKRRGGATTSLILGIAGVIGVGVAGGMAITGTTPCSIMSACGIKSDAKVETVAMTDANAGACPVTGRAGVIAASTTAAADSGCCSEKTETVNVETVALADCSNDPECAVDDGVACSTKGPDCHKVQPAADGVQVQVITASQTEAKAEGELCAMAASCSPANCTEGMMKACTDAGKICPEDKSAQATTFALAAEADCSNDPECAVDDGIACSTKGPDCHKVQPAAAQTVANEAASSCCSDKKAEAEIVAVAPDALRPLFTLQFSGKGMPMLIPASLTTQSACEVKEAGSCGGEKKAACSTATTASLN